MMPKPVTVERIIPAPAEKIFDLLADPAGHARIDGSGTVTAARSGGRRLAKGGSFRMNMQWGVGDSSRNLVVEFEENRRIAWRTLAPNPVLSRLFTGRTWRYELEPVAAGTLVRETWDPTTEALPGRALLGRLSELTQRNMAATLVRIEEIVTAQG